MNENFYITTAILYTSGTPHIGNIYEIILADTIARYKRLEGKNVYFQTGTDEHGLKIQKKAKEANIHPQQFVDNIANEIKTIFDSVNINYDYFIRTTSKHHVKTVQQMFKKLYDQGDIYKSFYEGMYCVTCESFFTETQATNSKCPDCDDLLEIAKEEAYFLRLSKYQKQLQQHIVDNPDFIQPESRKNEMINNFLKEPLPDLAVSRTSFTWGIPVDFDDGHIVYVWLDALSNYITGLGFDVNGNHSELFNKFWPCDVHLIGKDILRFHTIYWPIMLLALGVPLPKKVFGHPWLLVGDGKMSKSKGNSMYTTDLVNQFGVDAVRYYVLRETPFASDGVITPDIICERYNSELVNTLSNLVNRTISMVFKYQNGKVMLPSTLNDVDKSLRQTVLATKKIVQEKVDALKISDAIQQIMSTLRRTNKYIDETEPWIVGKENNLRIHTILYNLLESIRHCAILLSPVIPNATRKILSQISADNVSWDSLNSFDGMSEVKLGQPEVVFQRLDVNKILTQYEERISKTKNEYLSIEEFSKLKLVIGEVISSEPHSNAERLLVSKIDIGTEIRQIVSGIKDHISPDEFVGKKVLVVINLKPVKIRGIMSEGMILVAKDGDNMDIVTSNLNKGAIVS